VVTVALPEARSLAFGVVAGQAAVTGLVALVCWRIAGSNAARSAVIGGGISTAASLAMVLLAFRSSVGSDPRRAARAFYVGEASKLAIVIALFVIVLKFVKIAAGALFAGYLATFLVYWVALARVGAGPGSRDGRGG
jgi:ATP synthase protein I